jgi:hypothetical protein
MWSDPIVEEIHQIRADHAARFNYDLAAIVEDIKKQEKQSGKKFVSFPPRLLPVGEAQIPNATTRKSLDDAKERRNLESFENAQTFFEAVGV